MGLRERTITIVSQNRWYPFVPTEHDIEITVNINIGGPDSRVARSHDCRRQLCLRCDVGEFVCAFLFQQMNAAGSREDQISLEIVIEIKPGNAFWSRGNSCLPARERIARISNAHFFFVSQHNRGCAFASSPGGGLMIDRSLR